jgi:hypothetical protein
LPETTGATRVECNVASLVRGSATAHPCGKRRERDDANHKETYFFHPIFPFFPVFPLRGAADVRAVPHQPGK